MVSVMPPRTMMRRQMLPPDSHETERLRLADGTRALGLELGPDAIDNLLGFLDRLQEWNRVYNLTAIRERNAMLTQHVLDSLSTVTPLRRMRGTAAQRMLDVGSGGGLPGVPIAIACPEFDFTCIDSVAKKADFVHHVVARLRLPNVHAIHARVEALTGGAYDVVITRAFAPLAATVMLTRACLARDGVWLAMKGRDPVDERRELPADIEVFHVERLTVPGLAAARCIVWMRRTSANVDATLPARANPE